MSYKREIMWKRFMRSVHCINLITIGLFIIWRTSKSIPYESISILIPLNTIETNYTTVRNDLALINNFTNNIIINNDDYIINGEIKYKMYYKSKYCSYTKYVNHLNSSIRTNEMFEYDYFDESLYNIYDNTKKRCQSHKRFIPKRINDIGYVISKILFVFSIITFSIGGIFILLLIISLIMKYI